MGPLARSSLGPPVAGRKVEPQPCPFCGASVADADSDSDPLADPGIFRICRDGRSAWQVLCVLCGARGPSIATADTKDVGIVVACVDAWNRRVKR